MGFMKKWIIKYEVNREKNPKLGSESEERVNIVTIGLKYSLLNLFLAVLGFSFAMGDALSTWYGIRSNKAVEENPITIYTISKVGLAGTLSLLILISIFLTIWCFLYSNDSKINFLFKSIALIWVIQKFWVLTSNLLVLNGVPSISIVHILKILNII